MTTLVMLYGPPAVGKETVARALQKITSYHLLLNHQFADLVGPIFGFRTLEAVKINAKVRLVIYGEIAKAEIEGVISTFSYYGHAEGDRYIKRWVDTVERWGGRMCFARLFCDEKTLLERVGGVSRIASSKISTAEKLAEVLRGGNALKTIPSAVTTSFEVDTTDDRPEEVARKIKKHFRL